MKLEHVGMMLHVGPSFVLYALLLDLGCCLKAHIELDGQFGSEKEKKVCVQKGNICKAVLTVANDAPEGLI